MIKQGQGKVPQPVDGTVAKLVQILPEKNQREISLGKLCLYNGKKCIHEIGLSWLWMLRYC